MSALPRSFGRAFGWRGGSMDSSPESPGGGRKLVEGGTARQTDKSVISTKEEFEVMKVGGVTI